MKKIKKLSVVVVALTMCLLLGMVAWAVTALSSSTPSNSGQDVSDVTYSATLDKPTVCYDEVKDQTVTLTVKTNKAVDMDGLTAQVTVPNGLTLKSVSNEKLTGETYIYDSETNMLMWYSPDAVNVSNDLLATITLTVPKDTAKADYEIGFKIIDISKVEGEGEDDAKAGVVWAEDVSLSATLTVADHDYGTEWKSDETNHWHECACGAKSDVAEHDFASGDCVCGAKKPVTDITVIHKGDALANAYTVDGSVVTVTFDKACKLGYWDATNSKYVAISATLVGGNTYSFTAPEGVTEVLLVVKGDVTGDGALSPADTGKLNASLIGRGTLTTVAAFAGDVTGEGTLSPADTGKLNASLIGRGTLAWN